MSNFPKLVPAFTAQVRTSPLCNFVPLENLSQVARGIHTLHCLASTAPMSTVQEPKLTHQSTDRDRRLLHCRSRFQRRPLDHHSHRTKLRLPQIRTQLPHVSTIGSLSPHSCFILCTPSSS